MLDARPRYGFCHAALTSEALKPPSYFSRVIVESRAKLAAHLGFFEGDMDPIRSREHQEGRDEYKNSAGRHSYSEAEDNEAKIHGVARAPKRSIGDQLVVGSRSGIDLSARTPEQDRDPNRSNETEHDESDSDGGAV